MKRTLGMTGKALIPVTLSLMAVLLMWGSLPAVAADASPRRPPP